MAALPPPLTDVKRGARSAALLIATIVALLACLCLGACSSSPWGFRTWIWLEKRTAVVQAGCPS